MHTPQKWLKNLERHLSWLAIPNISILWVTLQGLGFFMVQSDPVWMERLALIPDRVILGEGWRLITFLALPLSLSPIWVLFVLWFIYYILNEIESEWGSFQTTLYFLIAYLLSITFSMLFNYPIFDIRDIEASLFLAAATLFPHFQVRLFMIIPVKMKWLGAISGFFLILRLFQVSWTGKLYLFFIYFNYLLFFGPILLNTIKQMFRKWNYQRKLR